MALKVKSMAESVRKWQANSRAESAAYARESQAAASTYGQNTGAAEQAFKSAVSAAGVSERFARNARSKGQAKYARKIASVGEARYAEGVDNSGQEYTEGFAPYATILQSATLSARGPRGSAGNKKRSDEVQELLHRRRIGGVAAGR